MRVLTGMMAGAGITAAVGYYRHRPFVTTSDTAGVYGDSGIGTARREVTAAAGAFPAAVSIPAGVPAAWMPKINNGRPPEPAPSGMVWVPGG